MTLPVALAGHDIIGQEHRHGQDLASACRSCTGRGPGEADIAARASRSPRRAPRAKPQPGRGRPGHGVLAAQGPHRADLRWRAYVQIEAINRAPRSSSARLAHDDLLEQGHLDLSTSRRVVPTRPTRCSTRLPARRRSSSPAPPPRDTMLFSATMPGPSSRWLPVDDPAHPHPRERPRGPGATVKNIGRSSTAHALDRSRCRASWRRGRGLTIVFARTKRTAAKVADDLSTRLRGCLLSWRPGQGARAGLRVPQRQGRRARRDRCRARGIDADDVTHVVNYQCPEDEGSLHARVARRAGNKGTAVTFVDWDDAALVAHQRSTSASPSPSRPTLLRPVHRPRHPRYGAACCKARAPRGPRRRVLEDLGEIGKRTASGGRGRGRQGARRPVLRGDRRGAVARAVARVAGRSRNRRRCGGEGRPAEGAAASRPGSPVSTHGPARARWLDTAGRYSAPRRRRRLVAAARPRAASAATSE